MRVCKWIVIGVVLVLVGCNATMSPQGEQQFINGLLLLNQGMGYGQQPRPVIQCSTMRLGHTLSTTCH